MSCPEDRLLRLEAVVKQQQDRISALEAHVERLEARHRADDALGDAAAAGRTIENGALSESMQMLTSQLERKLRASDTFASGAPDGPFAGEPSWPPQQHVDRAAFAGGQAQAPQAQRRPSSGPPEVGRKGDAARASTSRCAPSVTTPPSDKPIMPRPPNSGPRAIAASPAAARHADAGPRTSLTSIPAAAACRPAAVLCSPSPALCSPAASPAAAVAANRAKSPTDAVRTPSHPRARASPQRGSGGTPSRPGSNTPSRPSSAGRSRPMSASRPKLEQVARLQGQTEQPVTGIVVSECGSGLVSAGIDGQLQLWSRSEEPQGLGTTTRSAPRWRRTLTQPVGGGEINGIALLGSTLACGCQDGSVRLFRLLREAGAFVLYSFMRKQHTEQPATVTAGTPTADAAAAARQPAAAPASSLSEVMCVGLSSAHGSRNSPLLASGAQVRTAPSASSPRVDTCPHRSPPRGRSQLLPTAAACAS